MRSLALGCPPLQVDWQGQRTQIDLAVKHGLRQVVLVSRQGSTPISARFTHASRAARRCFLFPACSRHVACQRL